MFLDASAVVAILKREPDRDDLLGQLQASRTAPRFSPLSRFEAIVSLARAESGQHRTPSPERLDAARQTVDRFFENLGAETVDLTDPIGSAALDAARAYGRAVGHPAALNLGDCFAYACAKSGGVALLYKGEDFARTDLA